jgi:large exoprotein involved in heme utilization and adhesion
MSKSFRNVWNAREQAYAAAAQTVNAKGKPSSRAKAATAIAAVLGSLWTQSAYPQTAPPPNTLPKGGQVSAGQAQISTSGANMVIQQGSDRAAINWQSFNVGKDAQVQFQQPGANSVVLNRVMSSDPSLIFGRISSNYLAACFGC